MDANESYCQAANVKLTDVPYLLLVYLRRPPAQHEQYRLDRILKRKAEQGVRIFVQIYKVGLTACNILSNLCLAGVGLTRYCVLLGSEYYHDADQ